MFNRPVGAPRLGGIHSRAILMSAATMALGATAYGQTVPPPDAHQNDWIGPTILAVPAGANWLDPVNWSYDDDGNSGTPGTQVLPSTIANHFATINNNGLVIVDGVAEAAFLTLGMTYRGPGDFDQGHMRIDAGAVLTLGELRVGGRESLKALFNVDPTPDPYLQDGGIGTVLQTGGTVNVNYTHGQNPGGGAFWEPPVQSMYVGDSAADLMPTPGDNHAEGTYQMNGGTLNVGLFSNDQLVIGTGLKTKGTFIQQGGDVVSTGNVFVARRGATGSYTISGGSLLVHGATGIQIGDGETASIAPDPTLGTFTQSGASTVTVRADVRIGRRNGTGVYNLSSGTLNIATIDSIYTTGTIPVRGTLNIGSLGEGASAGLMNSTGTLNLSGDAIINIGRSTDLTTDNVSNLNVGLGNSGTGGAPTGNRGFLEMTGGTINMHRPGSRIVVGDGTNVIGTANISGGTINHTAGTGSVIQIGRNSGGGTLTLSGTGTINASQVSLDANNTAGVVRSFIVNGGTLNTDLVTFAASNSAATRLFQITNGTVTMGDLISGAINAPGSAVTDISGGTVSLAKMTLGGGSVVKLSNINLSIPGVTTVTSQTNVGNYEIAAGSTLTLAGGVTTPATIVRNFRTQNGTGTLTIAGTQSYGAAGTNLHHNAGTLNLDSNANGNLTLNANSTANLNSDQRLTALNVGSNATTTMTSSGPNPDRTLHVNSLTVSTTGGKLDMTDNDMIVNYTSTSPEFELRDKVLNARAGGSHGIFYTRTVADDTILAFGEASELAITSFNSTPVDTTTVVGKYTYYGDANFDGQVTTDDYVAVDLGLGTGDSWVQGDFDLNGAVTTDDYVVVDLNLGKGTTNPLAFAETQAEMIALHTEMFGQSYVDKLAYASENGWVAASVPEPGALSLVGLGALGLLGRRRRAMR